MKAEARTPHSRRASAFRLRHASSFHETAQLCEERVAGDGLVATGAFSTLSAR